MMEIAEFFKHVYQLMNGCLEEQHIFILFFFTKMGGGKLLISLIR